MKNKNKLNYSPIIFSTLIVLTITIIFTLMYGTHGIEGSDTSYLRGFSYDLIHGKKLKENIFFSFPFTLFFSSLIYLPMITGNVLLERFFHFLLIGITSYCSFSFLRQKEDKSNHKLIYFLPVILILNISNFPVGINYTIIASTLGCLAIFLHQREKSLGVGLCLSLSYFSKDSFLFFNLLFLIIIFFEKDREYFLKTIAFIIVGTISFKLLELTPIYGKTTPSFVKIALKTNLRKLFNSGIKAYFQDLKFIFIILGYYANHSLLISKKKIIFTSLFFCIATYKVFTFNQQYVPWAIPIGIMAFNLLLGDTLFKIKRKIFNANILLFLSLAWSTGLSDTQPGPWPLIGTFFFIHTFKKSTWAVISAVIFFSINHYFKQYPYRTAPRSELNYDLGKINPLYKYIYTSEDKFKKINEMIELSKIYKRVHVLPAFSDANIFMNKLFCLPMTWDVAASFGKVEEFVKYDPFIKKELKNCDAIILEKNVPTKYTLRTRYVLKHWKKIKETTNYIVYQEK